MRQKSGFFATNRSQRSRARAVWAVLLAATLLISPTVLGDDEGCQLSSTKFTSPTNNLCVPAATNINIDGDDSEWAAGTFFEHRSVNGASEGRVRITRRATGIDKSDLFLAFRSVGDATPSFNDEVRIGLNPVANPSLADAAKNTLIKIHPFPTPSPSPVPAKRESFTFTPGAPGAWVASPQASTDALIPPANVAQQIKQNASTWTVEVKISLDAIQPLANAITGSDFRLSLELHADSGNNILTFRFPENIPPIDNEFVCSNPQRWHPMSFATGDGPGTNCPHPDLSIANGLYSCDAVYVLRNGTKSNEIAVGQVNEFHADVTNPGPGNANDAVVYFTLMKLGISAGPIAMNYSHNDGSIRNFFKDKFGDWMNATDSLDTGTPKPPTPFNINSGTTNTAARFSWKPSDETRFGPVTGFVDGHRCVAAFVNFKDDPNFANNFSFCNMAIVNCPTGENCLKKITVGQFYPGIEPQPGVQLRLKVTKFNQAELLQGGGIQVRIEGPNLARQEGDIFDVPVPPNTEVDLNVAMSVPRGIYKGQTPGATGAAPPAEGQGNNVDPREADFRRIFGDNPIVVIEGSVPAGTKRGEDGKPVQLYTPTSYVAFVLTQGPGPQATPTPPQDKGCGQGTTRGYLLAFLLIAFALGILWLLLRRRKKSGTY